MAANSLHSGTCLCFVFPLTFSGMKTEIGAQSSSSSSPLNQPNRTWHAQEARSPKLICKRVNTPSHGAPMLKAAANKHALWCSSSATRPPRWPFAAIRLEVPLLSLRCLWLQNLTMVTSDLRFCRSCLLSVSARRSWRSLPQFLHSMPLWHFAYPQGMRTMMFLAGNYFRNNSRANVGSILSMAH